MNKKVLLIAGLAAVLCIGGFVAILAIGGLAAVGMTQPATQAADNFMAALRAGDYNQAFNLCSPELQNELKDVQGLEAMIKSNSVQPATWNFTSRNVNNGTAEMQGNVTFAGTTSHTGTVSLILNRVGSNWQVAGFDLKGD